VRNLEREISNICRKVARRVVKTKQYFHRRDAERRRISGVIKFAKLARRKMKSA